MKPSSQFVRSIASLVLAIGFAFPVIAQETPSEQGQPIVVLHSTILTIDSDRLFSSSLYGQRVIAEVIARRDALIEENRTVAAALEAEEKELTERRDDLSREDFTKLAQEFDTKSQEIRAERNAKSDELGATLEAERQIFTRIAQDVLLEIMNERRALAIFSIDLVFMPADQINITDEAIARINELIGDGTN